MKSYIKIYGPPILKAIRKLEQLAVSTPQVCIMDPVIASNSYRDSDEVAEYFDDLNLVEPISVERCNNIFSKDAELLGEYDFFFEWFDKPTQLEINDLIEKIDVALTPLGCKYTITTKNR